MPFVLWQSAVRSDLVSFRFGGGGLVLQLFPCFLPVTFQLKLLWRERERLGIEFNA